MDEKVERLIVAMERAQWLHEKGQREVEAIKLKLYKAEKQAFMAKSQVVEKRIETRRLEN